jgi:hypothetical protein
MVQVPNLIGHQTCLFQGWQRQGIYRLFVGNNQGMPKRKFKNLSFELLRLIAVFLLAAVSWVLR